MQFDLFFTNITFVLTLPISLHLGQVMKVRLSCYLVLLSFDSKTRLQDSCTSAAWPKWSYWTVIVFKIDVTSTISFRRIIILIYHQINYLPKHEQKAIKSFIHKFLPKYQENIIKSFIHKLSCLPDIEKITFSTTLYISTMPAIFLY